ncbi:1004_t:CDS:1 [Paraglomus occultum]|uniref:1004_t:CDS:1 n=1 Tax=Paraglomus occultum TaxID=144539 RepID=A0A9N8VFH5_9GLOM|nr:1004_t:CDS:1 [Paraglomus occultum]
MLRTYLEEKANGMGTSTYYDASRFFNEMKDKTFTGPYDHIIKFSGATYFESKKISNTEVAVLVMVQKSTLALVMLIFYWLILGVVKSQSTSTLSLNTKVSTSWT